MSDPKQVLLECMSIIDERGTGYGNGIESNFARIAELFELSTGVKIKPHEAALFLVCVKLARMQQSPTKLDNYVDLINYTAFAAAMIDSDLARADAYLGA